MLTIRAATIADVGTVTAFGRRTFEETFGSQNTADDMAVYVAAAFNEARQAAELQDPGTITLLAEDGGACVGYAQLAGGAPPPCVTGASPIELVRFYVDRRWHGRGVAARLMQEVDLRARARAETIWLGVWEHNPRAIAFYRKCGFVDVGSHVFHLGRDPQIDRIMSRPLLGARHPWLGARHLWAGCLAPRRPVPGTCGLFAWHSLCACCSAKECLEMPRPRRITPAETMFHVVNRGNERRKLFLQEADYEAFTELLCKTKRRYPLSIYAHQLMPNHFHLLLKPHEDGVVSAALHWLQTRSSCYLRLVTNTRGDGHVFQRRFWCRAVTSDYEYLIVAKYIEANALRAGLVKRAEDWRWGSLRERLANDPRIIDPPPVELPPDWVKIVNLRSSPQELAQIRRPPTSRQ